MIYGTPTKNEDGMYYVKACADNKNKFFIQLNGVRVTSVDGGEVTVTLKDAQKILDIDALNLASSVENSTAWFGKELSEETVQTMYTSSVSKDTMTIDIIPQTRVFNIHHESIGVKDIKAKYDCNIIVEFAGLWFAKKTFGAVWNLVQVKTLDEPIVETYPETYAFQDDQ